ncbi:MAG TPA: glucosaminidase domain-containing protein [Acidimicrobiales bacterium]|nr:glucosaminidase domain-containing protein [Acidimicrobiales bacterium]
MLAAVLVTALSLLALPSAAVGQSAPPTSAPTTTTPTNPGTPGTEPAAPPPSLPPGIPTVSVPTPPSTDPAAPAPEPEPPLPDPSPQVAVMMAKITLLNAQQVLDLTQAAFLMATESENKVRGARDAAQHDFDIKQELLTDAVSNAYVRGNDVGGSAPATVDDYVPNASARLLAGTAIERDRVQLNAATERLQRANAALEQATARTSQTAGARDYAQASFDDATEAVAKAGRLSNRSDVSPTVVGEPVLTADELVGWYRSEGIVGYVGGVDLPTLAKTYIDEGNAEHVRGDVAFAQSIVETGAFTSPLTTHNNYAGIGACDTCPTGFDFPSPQMGVRAQMQLLHAYADKTLRTQTLANPPVGSDPDSLGVRGCCETWNALTGTWATDPNYGPKLMTVYLSMLEYALVTRTQAASATT